MAPLAPGADLGGHVVEVVVDAAAPPTDAGAPSGNRVSARNVRQAPAVSCSSATRYRPGTAAGMDATLCMASVFLKGMWHEIHDEVPM